MKFFILNWKKRENENFSIIGNRLQNDGSVNSIRPNCSLGLSYRSRSLLLTFGRSGSSNLDGKFPPFQWNAKNPIVSVTVAITTNRKNVLKGPMKGMILKRDNLTCAVLWVFVNSSLEYNYGGTVPASLIFFSLFLRASRSLKHHNLLHNWLVEEESASILSVPNIIFI